ncbi:MAG TPA: hypothetical protein VGJ60_22005 [Chloroflexota bacterium]
MTTTPLYTERRARVVNAPTFRSRRGAIGALVLLLALPFTIASEIAFPGHSEVVIHTALAIGTFIIALSAFDFETPKWLSLIACFAGCTLAAIFLAQGLAAFTDNDPLRTFAYSPEIGGWGETLTVSIVMAWLIAVARTYGHGLASVLGVLSALTVIGLGIWSLVVAPLGGTPAELRLLFLLPVGWLLFVSTRPSHA